MNTEARATAQRAYAALVHAGETGDWAPILDMLTDDFEFLFPAGPLRGRHSGAEGKQKFQDWAERRRDARSWRILDLTLFSDEWAVFCVDTKGKDAHGTFETHVALFFRVSGDKISGYREYIGDLAAWI